MQNSISSIFQFIIFLIILIILQSPMIYYKRDHPIIIQSHPLYEVFNNGLYKHILNHIHQEQYTQLITDNNTYVQEFLSYFADSHRNNLTILTRYYKNNSNQYLYKAYKWIRYLIEDYYQNILPEEKQKRVWILFGLQEDIPQEDIKQLMEKYPSNKVILFTKNGTQIDKFVQHPFPQLDPIILQQIVSEKFNLSRNSSHFLIKYQGFFGKNLSRIFKLFNTSTFSLQQHLQTYYHNISDLLQKQRKLLDKLCFVSIIPWSQINNYYEINISKIYQFGVIEIDKGFTWKDFKYIENYALQANKDCLINLNKGKEMDPKQNFIRIQKEHENVIKKYQEMMSNVKTQIKLQMKKIREEINLLVKKPIKYSAKKQQMANKINGSIDAAEKNIINLINIEQQKINDQNKI